MVHLISKLRGWQENEEPRHIPGTPEGSKGPKYGVYRVSILGIVIMVLYIPSIWVLGAFGHAGMRFLKLVLCVCVYVCVRYVCSTPVFRAC